MFGLSKIRSALAGLGCAVGLVASGSAFAADLPTRPIAPAMPLFAPSPNPIFVRVGISAVFADTNVNTSIAFPGPAFSPVTGSNAQIATVPAAYFEAGYYFTRNIAVSLAGGFPPTFTTTGTGTLAPQGVLYRAVVGLPVFAITYHIDYFGPLRPYAGVGVGYSIVFRNEAAAVTSPLLRNKAAFVLVGGIDYDVSEHWGVFIDVKKAFLTQSFTGVSTVTLPPPFPPGIVFHPQAIASVKTDPVIATVGISYRF